MSRLLTFVALASLACRLKDPLATACRTDDDCVGANRCVGSICRAAGASVGTDADGSGGPSRAPGGPSQGGEDALVAPDGGAASEPDAAGAEAAIAVDGPALPGDARPIDTQATLAPDAAAPKPDTAALPPDAMPLPPDTAPLPPDAMPLPPDAAPLPVYSGDPCCAIAGLCPGGATKNTGEVTIAPTTDLVPLCSGWVMLGDRAANKVVVHNVFTGADKVSYQLSTAPNRLLLDVPHRLAFVAFGGATTSLARIELETGKVSAFNLSAPAKDIALSGSGQLLALTGTDQYDARNLEIVDEGTGETTVITRPAGLGNMLAYRPAGSLLFVGVVGLSPSGLSRFTLDWGQMKLSALDSLWDDGSNCHEIVLSPDGAHLAVPCGAGNGTPPYTIYDRSTEKLTTVSGEWMTGAYPAGAAFSPDGKYFAASDTKAIQIFSVTTHARLSTTPTTACAYGNITKVRTSLDSAFVYALSPCGFDADSAQLSWVHAP
jgi:WD40 repeat protein